MNKPTEIIKNICAGSRQLNREKLLEFESVAKTMPQLDIPVTHYIHGGMYCREITIPKDTILTGQIYKFDHFDIMIKGDITVSTDSGETKRFKGYNCFKGMSGKKRAGFAHEDTTWITIHPFSGADGEEIQKFITAETFEELNIFNTTINKADYLSFVKSSGLSESTIREQVENIEDIRDLPEGYDHLYIDDSSLEGKGFFSKRKILENEVICPSRISDKRTPAGRYVNHAILCNAKMVFSNGDILLIASRDIEPKEEITVNYRDAINTGAKKGDLLCQE